MTGVRVNGTMCHWGWGMRWVELGAALAAVCCLGGCYAETEAGSPLRADDGTTTIRFLSPLPTGELAIEGEVGAFVPIPAGCVTRPDSEEEPHPCSTVDLELSPALASTWADLTIRSNGQTEVVRADWSFVAASAEEGQAVDSVQLVMYRFPSDGACVVIGLSARLRGRSMVSATASSTLGFVPCGRF